VAHREAIAKGMAKLTLKMESVLMWALFVLSLLKILLPNVTSRRGPCGPGWYLP
jgi:hypothetical protein